MPDAIIEMRSDTMTKPTPAMREAIANAEVGDDMSGEDPTVNRLEAMIAERLGKEAAVFACSGTQSNQMGVRVHCRPGDELLIEAWGHIASYEAGGPAALSGVTCRPIIGRRGLLEVSDLEGQIHNDDQHLCPTRLVCVENTANRGGGVVYSLGAMQQIGAWAHENGLKVHMDGARLFNAVVAGGYTAQEICEPVDTISVCFSKGLGCPMGSALIGSEEEIRVARRARKLFGGAMRQSGIVAAAAIYALENNVDRMQEDHDNARAFAEALSQIEGIEIEMPETNLVFFDVEEGYGSAFALSSRLRELGVNINPTGPQSLRACTHLDLTREQSLRAAELIGDSLSKGLADVAESITGGPYASR
ncbi:L-allo-threonine aldolase [Symmachiella macrocystis]|uniref:L-allo-threonine aldolase n=1 Tax=Symmachiella macrocystis TaxID=2527985 RepID=A0A5C6BAN7_9PLAN|nr:GntG family PLP-dependent aldolase [Symmachiella macrocystis]TWU08777.1 L-allo-threonine aldolase [Symmachiella macrocystis]